MYILVECGLGRDSEDMGKILYSYIELMSNAVHCSSLAQSAS